MDCKEKKYKTIVEASKCYMTVDELWYCYTCECWHPNSIPMSQLYRTTVQRMYFILGDKILQWVYQEVPALGGVTPLSCLTTREGLQKVNDVLTQMEHGVW